MDILLALLVFTVGFLLYSAAQLVRARRGRTGSARETTARVAADANRSGQPCEPRRALERISASQFTEVLARCEDLVVIDLRPAHQNAPLPIQAPRVVRLGTHELEALLRDLPEDRSAVFCGVSDLSVFMIMTSLYMRGSAPLYVLRWEPAHEEAA